MGPSQYMEQRRHCNASNKKPAASPERKKERNIDEINNTLAN